MILDQAGILAENQTLGASGYAKNLIDLGANNRNFGAGEPMEVIITLLEDLVNTGTYNAELRTSDTNDGANPDPVLNGTVWGIINRTIDPAAKAGTQFRLPVPGDVYQSLAKVGNLEFLGLYWTLGGSGASVVFSASLQPRSMDDSYSGGNIPSGYSVGK